MVDFFESPGHAAEVLDEYVKKFTFKGCLQKQTFFEKGCELYKDVLALHNISPDQKYINENEIDRDVNEFYLKITELHYYFKQKNLHDESLGDGPGYKVQTRLRLLKLSYCRNAIEHIKQVVWHVNHLIRLSDDMSDGSVPPMPSILHSQQDYFNTQNPTRPDDRKGSDKKNEHSPYEQLLRWLLGRCLVLQLRKRNDMVYQQRMVKFAGKTWGSRAWTYATLGSQRDGFEGSTVEAMVYVLTCKEENPDMWSLFVNLRSPDRIVNYLRTSEDLEFPLLKPERRYLSFLNGIYDTQAEGDGAFYPYELVNTKLPSNAVSAKIFEHVMLPEWIQMCTNQTGHGWWHVPTPKFQSILDYQNWGCIQKNTQDNACADQSSSSQAKVTRGQEAAALVQREIHMMEQNMQQMINDVIMAPGYEVPAVGARVLAAMRAACDNVAAYLAAVADPTAANGDSTVQISTEVSEAPFKPGNSLITEVQVFVYVFMGRMLHALGTFDSWQIIFFLKGRGGSGKSTAAHICSQFFNRSDVGILSNNIESKFGLQNLVDKYMFICFEVKKNFSLDQADFQSLVSGEDISVARKNTSTKEQKWTLPGLMCGNEAPGYMDSQGSLTRRLAIVNFKYGVAERDCKPDLLREILNELKAQYVQN